MVIFQQVLAELPLLPAGGLQCLIEGRRATLLGHSGDVRSLHADCGRPNLQSAHKSGTFPELFGEHCLICILYLLQQSLAVRRDAVRLHRACHDIIPSCQLFAGLGVVFTWGARAYDRYGRKLSVHRGGTGNLSTTGRHS